MLQTTVVRKSVLWIDDEADLLQSHRIFLQQSGYDVELATNADDGIELLRRRAFDVVLLDEQNAGQARTRCVSRAP